MFAIAVEPEIINHLTAEDGGLLDLLSALKEATPWARSLGESVFFQFCECLVKARKEWQGNPRLPFDPSQHSQTARSIDNFLREIGDRWNDVEFEIYELVGGWEEDDENNENDSGPSTSNNGLTSGVDINMGDLTTALEDDIEEDNIREGVRRMDINDEM
ncbi:putative glutamate carboxypeptidase 2 protein [Daldinia childiae]|uniref:putative glutamate carboxypeptidase 2 protein n=1 Tax=Daldinia childiae TaxID=326645 RepID=UPI001445EF26|nr:putative glutamate carboxypeptidase 2 protein [Daldinia childiae]KAF3069822.1 putative glutamate carboxypeptidase 2 protein [Daldinia childiae]